MPETASSETALGKFLAGGMAVGTAALTMFGVSQGVLTQVMHNAPAELLMWASLIALGVGVGVVASTRPTGEALGRWGCWSFAGLISAMVVALVLDNAFMSEAVLGSGSHPDRVLGVISLLCWVVGTIAVGEVLFQIQKHMFHYGADVASETAPTPSGGTTPPASNDHKDLLVYAADRLAAILTKPAAAKPSPATSVGLTTVWLLVAALLTFALGVGGLIALGAEVGHNHSRPTVSLSLTEASGQSTIELTVKAQDLNTDERFTLCIEGVNELVDDQASIPTDGTASGLVPCGVAPFNRDEYVIYETILTGDDTGKIDYTTKLAINPPGTWTKIRARVEKPSNAPPPNPPEPANTNTGLQPEPTSQAPVIDRNLPCRGHVLDDELKSCAIVSLAGRTSSPAITATVSADATTGAKKLTGSVSAAEPNPNGDLRSARLHVFVRTKPSEGSPAITLQTKSVPLSAGGTATTSVEAALPADVSGAVICVNVTSEPVTSCEAGVSGAVALEVPVPQS